MKRLYPGYVMRLYHDQTPPVAPTGRPPLPPAPALTPGGGTNGSAPSPGSISNKTVYISSSSSSSSSSSTLESICKVYCEHKAVMDLCNTKYLGNPKLHNSHVIFLRDKGLLEFQSIMLALNLNFSGPIINKYHIVELGGLPQVLGNWSGRGLNRRTLAYRSNSEPSFIPAMSLDGRINPSWS